MGPKACLILCSYWERLWMVACVGGYYGSEFQGFWGATQGEPLFPTLFNVVVEAVARHWISLVAGGAGGKGGWVSEVLNRAKFLYADDGLVASMDPVWLQGAFETLTVLFDRVELKKNPGRGSSGSAAPSAWWGLS